MNEKFSAEQKQAMHPSHPRRSVGNQASSVAESHRSWCLLDQGATMRRGLITLSGLGYVMFLWAGLDTGLGVYRTPAYCFLALFCAAAATACASKRVRLWWTVAGLAAIVCGAYGYHQNREWRERLERIRAEQSSSTVQPERNR